MRCIFLLALLVFFQLANGQAENQRGYTTLIDCLRQSFPDNGVAFDNTFSAFEAEFLKLNNMKDNSGKSYHAFLKNIANNKDASAKLPSLNATERMRKLEQPDDDKLKDCMSGFGDDMPANVENILNFSYSNNSLDNKSYVKKLAQTLLDNFTLEQMGQRFYQMTIIDALEQAPE